MNMPTTTTPAGPAVAAPIGVRLSCHHHPVSPGGPLRGPASATLTTQPQRLLDGQGGYGRKEQNQGRGSDFTGGRNYQRSGLQQAEMSCDNHVIVVRVAYATRTRLRRGSLTHRPAIASNHNRRRSLTRRWAQPTGGAL